MVLALAQPDSLRVSVSVYTFAAAADELTSVGKVETGMVKNSSHRIALKAALLPAYLVVTREASKSEHRWVRRVGWVGRWGVPAMFLGATIHNLRVKR